MQPINLSELTTKKAQQVISNFPAGEYLIIHNSRQNLIKFVDAVPDLVFCRFEHVDNCTGLFAQKNTLTVTEKQA